MVRSDWNLYAAIGLAVGIIALGILGHKWDARHYYEAPEPQYTVPNSGVAITEAPAAFYQGDYSPNQKATTPDQDSRSVMAAEDSAFWTTLSAIIGGAGTIIVSLSLIFSARATQAALDAAKSAKDTLHNDRAWVLMDDISKGYGKDVTINGEFIHNAVMVQIVWKNMGRSPALRVGMATDIKIAKRGDQPPIFDMPLELGNSVIGPDGRLCTGYLGLNDFDTQKVKSGSHHAVLYAKIIYCDIYRSDLIHSSEVCLNVVISGKKKDDQGKIEDVFMFMPTGPQNNAN